MYSTKYEFISALKRELEKNGIEPCEIAEDFEQHFQAGVASGLSEAQVCEKLGEPSEIAAQYVGDEVKREAEQRTFTQNTYEQSRTVNSAQGLSGGKITAVILLDVFVFVWAIPTLFSLLIAYWAVMTTLFVSSVLIVIGTAAGSIAGYTFFVSVLPPLANIFAAVFIFGLALFMSAFCISIWRGFIRIIEGIVKLHSDAFKGGAQ